jgi:hypothetical protein
VSANLHALLLLGIFAQAAPIAAIEKFFRFLGNVWSSMHFRLFSEIYKEIRKGILLQSLAAAAVSDKQGEDANKKGD